MSVLISHRARLQDRPNGTCPLGAEGTRERGGAVWIALGVKRHGHAVRTAPQLRQLEENVACRLALARGTREPAGARRAGDLHVVREALGSADEERLRQLESRLPTHDPIGVT